MESVVLHSDMARLILGYLLNNNLKRAALTFCRTSPHLHQEFVALRQGLQPHNFLNVSLEDIIREHVKITSMVANVVQKVPNDKRQHIQKLNLSERVDELLKLDKYTCASSRDSACLRNINSSTQRKRQRTRGRQLSDQKQPNSASPTPSEHVSCKRPRLLAPHLYCSVERSTRTGSNHVQDGESLNSSSSTDITSGHTDNVLIGHGPTNNSTPRPVTSDEPEVMMPTPQTMPVLTQAIMTNREFQAKLLKNINVALQSLTVHAPTAEYVDSEAVLDGLVRNILEATEKDPSFDRIIQEVVGMEVLPEEHLPAPPQTPFIIRTEVASANDVVLGDGNVPNVSNDNAVIQLNANSSICNFIDPNISISKLIVLNSNESAQKQQPVPSANLSFGSDNLINFVDNDAALLDADATVGFSSTSSGGQVCVDATNGQLTFPMFLSNEGLLSHLPLLVNNEWLAQQLRFDMFANTDVPETITVTANQLPSNSIIISSAVKQPPTTVESPLVEPPAQLIAEQTKPTTAVTKALPECSDSKVSNASIVPASLDSSRLVTERVTPSTSGIMNVKAFRSLSTPRKRTSHVRTLNFSPKAVTHMAMSPVPTRHRQHYSQRQEQLKALKEKQARQIKQTERPIIIQNVKIRPSFGMSPPAAVAATSRSKSPIKTERAASVADVTCNDNNDWVQPLFAMEENSNQTVIKVVTASKQAKQSKQPSSMATPKRKQKRHIAVKACKRIISKARTLVDGNQGKSIKKQQPLSQDKSTFSSVDNSKENQKNAMQQVVGHKEDLLAAWQRQMHGSSNDLEQRLREINAKRQELHKTSMRARRDRSTTSKNKTKPVTTPLVRKQNKLKSSLLSANKTKQKQMSEQHQQQQQLQQTSSANTTPKKPHNPAGVRQKLKGGKEIKHRETKETKKIKEVKKTNANEMSVQKSEQAQKQHLEAFPIKQVTKECPADGMGNIDVLLETPFKLMPSEAGDVPPTPGPALMPPLVTPYAKLPSTSFLFGSDTKSILDTPMLTAITPGVRLTTPFGHSLGTPHSSGAKTDYSSGSSYYRPDNAERTDTNVQCALQPLPPRDVHLKETIAKLNTIARFGLQAERLAVEPTVLRRVRSFGSEAVDSAEGAAALTANVDHTLLETPHYKLVSGLPDAVVDNSSNSSNASSSTSSNSLSSSGSSSHTSASSAPSSQAASRVLLATSIKLLDMENLSDISSTEDEEWLKTAAAVGSLNAQPLAIESEPAQLFSQDGEVRYPLRSWLTPSKDAGAAVACAEMTSFAPVPSATIKLTLPRKSSEKLSQQIEVIEQRMQNLAEVRERVKAKVKQQSQSTPKSLHKKTNKKLTAMRETVKLTNPNPINANKSPIKEHITEPSANFAVPSKFAPVTALSSAATVLVKSVPTLATEKNKIMPVPSEPKAITDQHAQSSRNLDSALLIALNLSAKKQQQPKVARAAMEISAQPVPSTATGQRRGRPKKSPNVEPTRGSMRRSSRLIDSKTPVPEVPQPRDTEATKLANTSTNDKLAKKPAKKRAEARLEPAALTLAALSEAQTTQISPEQQQQPAAMQAAQFVSGEYDLDIYRSTCHVSNTFGFAYADSGSKPQQRVPRQPPNYFKNFQMRIMVDRKMHSVRITSPQLLHRACPCEEGGENVTCIRNIPKKRIIHFTSGASQYQSVDQSMSGASCTPVIRNAQSMERHDDDLEVAAM